MRRNEGCRSRCPIRVAVRGLALVLGVMTCSGYATRLANAGGPLPNAPKKDQEFSHIYDCTLEEAFHASDEAVKRMGLFVDVTDKDKGLLSGGGQYHLMCGAGPCDMKLTFEIHIEPVSNKPETRVTVEAKRKTRLVGWGGGITQFKNDFLRELQKVLVTYR